MSKMKTCVECGELYQPTNHRQKYCKNDHYRECPICGEDYLWTGENKACSISCGVKLSNLNRKMAKRTCEFCGEEFTPKTAHQKYCQNPHPAECKNY